MLIYDDGGGGGRKIQLKLKREKESQIMNEMIAWFLPSVRNNCNV